MTLGERVQFVTLNGFDLMIFDPDFQTADSLAEIAGDEMSAVGGVYPHFDYLEFIVFVPKDH